MHLSRGDTTFRGSDRLGSKSTFQVKKRAKFSPRPTVDARGESAVSLAA